MGADNFECLNASQMYTFQFVIDTVTIYEGKHKNLDPLERYVIVEGESHILDTQTITQENEKRKVKEGGGNKAKGRAKDKKKKKKLKVKTVMEPVSEEKTEKEIRKMIYLPPFRISLRFFFNREINVDQVDLPGLFCEEESKSINNLALDSVKKQKKIVKRKKAKKKITEKKQEIPPLKPTIEWVTEDHYSTEELSWRLPSEKAFKQGICVTFSATAEQMVLWLQRGPFHLSLSRWKGYGEEISVGSAKLQFDAGPFIQMVLNRSRRLTVDSMSAKVEDTAEIIDRNGKKIGDITFSFNMICNGGIIISEHLVSERGLFGFLTEVASEQENIICRSCGKFGENYDYVVTPDLQLAIIPNASMFDNAPFLRYDIHKKYANALNNILTSYNPVAEFGLYLEQVARNRVPSEDIII